MGRPFTRDRLLGVAVLASLVVHAFGAFLIPPFSSIEALAPVEAISFVAVRRIEIEHREAPAARRSGPHRRIAPVPVALATPHPAPNRKSAVVSRIPPAAAAAAPRTDVDASRTQTTSGIARVPAPSPRATATAEARDVATTTDHHAAGGYMPFGAAEATPVLDPQVRKTLSGMNVRVALTIVVSDDGHTKSVQFDPPLDAAIERQIQSTLAAASWDPAYCGGGIPCESTIRIEL